MRDTSPPDRAPVYEIRIRGKLDARWAEWFDGLAIAPDGRGDTLLTGVLQDQAALYGVLRKLRDLGLPLIAVNCAGPDQGSWE